MLLTTPFTNSTSTSDVSVVGGHTSAKSTDCKSSGSASDISISKVPVLSEHSMEIDLSVFHASDATNLNYTLNPIVEPFSPG